MLIVCMPRIKLSYIWSEDFENLQELDVQDFEQQAGNQGK
jgi:hypothetical protein